MQLSSRSFSRTQVIRDLELMPQLLGSDWSSVFLQRFAGSVTILPKSRILVSTGPRDPLVIVGTDCCELM